MKRETARFSCSDAGGAKIVSIELTEFGSVMTLEGETSQYRGPSELLTEDGQWANQIDDDTFELKDGRIVRRG